jgi:hypothetical protein
MLMPVFGDIGEVADIDAGDLLHAKGSLFGFFGLRD